MTSSNVPVQRLLDALSRARQLVETRGALPDSIVAVTDDSRAVNRGGVFLAVRGVAADGHRFASGAVASGATLVVGDNADALRDIAAPTVLVRDSRRGAAIVAAAFFDEPARALTLVGVTGTNGKTTTVGMIRHLLDKSGGASASIGTLGVLKGSAGTPVPGGGDLTTPGPVELQRVLRVLVDAGVTSVVMEVSSHALHQRRVEGLAFDVAVFTNLTRDHLDYHGSMEEYFSAKASLVQLLRPTGTAVRNLDDPAWVALEEAPRWLSYGVNHRAAVMAHEVRYGTRGSEWQLATSSTSATVHLPLIGDFNVSNALGAAAAAIALGHDVPSVAKALSTMPQVPGRLEIIAGQPTVLRDYAHTPDALERALSALRPFVRGLLIVVFGAGGDRDRGKRPLMGRLATSLADITIVTSDNPRTEDPEKIIDDIVASLSAGSFERIEDRRAAIARALALADPERDVVLLAGKGHETYQIRGTEKLPFDERVVVGELMQSARAAAR